MLLESYEDEILSKGLLNIRSAIPSRDMPFSSTIERDFRKGYVSENWFRYRKKNKVGFLDKDKNLIIDFLYDEAGKFCEGMAGVQLGEKWGFIDETKSLVIDYQFDNVYDFCEGLCLVFEGGKGYFIDKTGKKISTQPFDSATYFRDGNAIISIGEKNGIINQQGEIIVPVEYDEIFHYFNDRACVVKEGKYGFVDKQGKVIFEPRFDYAYDFEYGFTKAIIKRVNEEDDEFFIHKDGRIVNWVSLSYFVWDDIEFTIVEDMGKYGFTDRAGNMIIETMYDDVEFFQEGFASIEVNGKYGFINQMGEEVIKPIYDYYEESNYIINGHVVMRLGNKIGMLNTKGEVVVDFIYGSMDFFVALVKDDDINLSLLERKKDINNVFYIVEKDNRYGMMNSLGEITLPVKYNVIHPLASGLILVCETEDSDLYFYYADGRLANEQGFKYITKVDGKTTAIYWQNDNAEEAGPFGFLDMWGNILTPPQYKDAREFGQGYYPNSDKLILAPIKNYQDSWGFIDITGKRVIACEFDDAMPFVEAYVPSKRKHIHSHVFFAMVKKDSKWGYIELEGYDIRMPIEYRYSEDEVKKIYERVDKNSTNWRVADEDRHYFE